MDLHVVALDDEIVTFGVVADEAELSRVEIARLGDVERGQHRNAAGEVDAHASNALSVIASRAGGCNPRDRRSARRAKMRPASTQPTSCATASAVMLSSALPATSRHS